MVKGEDVIAFLESQRNEEQRQILMRFFKTGKGDYGEGDEFLGLKVPQTRQVVKAVWKDFPLEEVPVLLMSRWHEVRLCGLLILVEEFRKSLSPDLSPRRGGTSDMERILKMYLDYADRANNWDLVDLSAYKILGVWLTLPTRVASRDDKIRVLDSLAQSDNLWRQRMSIVCTLTPMQHGDASWCLRYAEIHLQHRHDLMHKAVGWMLREMGKRVSMDLLRTFLFQHAETMPRTTLRYAIERMPPDERRYWMQKKVI